MNITQQTSDKNLKLRLIKNKIFKYTLIILALSSSIPLVLILFELIKKGYKQININFFVETAPDTMEAMVAIANKELIPGGIANGIVGTLIIIGMASIIAIPLGIITGVYLSENTKGFFPKLVGFIVDILQGVPSIVLGAISYIWIVIPVTGGFSALAGSVALSIMMLPSIIRSTEETLKMIPNTLREAAFALGVPYHKVIFKVVIPTGISGIITGVILGISRIAGETAPLMLTALGSMAINTDISKPTSAIPLLVWEFYNDPNLVGLIWSASLLLLILILILNITAKIIAQRWKVQY